MASGAQCLLRTAADAGVSVCFANPGTSEMHFVAALDTNPGMRCILGLFEGTLKLQVFVVLHTQLKQ